MKYSYHVNLDERGMYSADIRDESEKTIYEIPTIYDLSELIEDGFIKSGDDMNGWHEYLCSLGIINLFDTLEFIG